MSVPTRILIGDDEFTTLVGDSPAMTDLRDTIGQLARVDSTLLLTGETGAGKELVARLIHRQSARRDGPCVNTDCRGVHVDRFERDFPGRVAEAAGGTLVLDEVGDLPAPLQAAVLRFLQDPTSGRTGDDQARQVDVRLIALTQRNLRQAVEAGDFRADLFFRLSAVPVEIPPLRLHPEDLPALCRHLIDRICRKLDRAIVDIDAQALEVLQHYAFPGNVRELENLLERALVLTAGRAGETMTIRASDLPGYLLTEHAPPVMSLALEGGFQRLSRLHDQLERDLMTRALQRWPLLTNQQIAQRLGTNRRVFELRLKQYAW